MVFPEVGFRLKNGTICALRSPEYAEAAQRLAFFRQVNGETDGLARGAEDSPQDVLLAAEMIDEISCSAVDLELCAWIGERMIACGSIGPVSAGQMRRRHRARVGIAVLREFWAQGLGSVILAELLAAAFDMGYLQAELTVAADNVRAIRLYDRAGFVQTGRIPSALRLENGTFVEEFMMIKTL